MYLLYNDCPHILSHGLEIIESYLLNYNMYDLESGAVKLILAQGPHRGKSITKWAGLVKSWCNNIKITITSN